MKDFNGGDTTMTIQIKDLDDSDLNALIGGAGASVPAEREDAARTATFSTNVSTIGAIKVNPKG